MKIARNTDAMIAAESIYATYKEYQTAGFTEAQAFVLILETLKAVIIAQANGRK